MNQNGFIHSERVPRLYKLAAKIAQGVSEGKGSIKQLVYNNKKHPNIKALYALVVLTFQRNNHLDYLVKQTQLFTKEPRLDPWLARILITELIWGKKVLRSECKPIKTILGYQQNLKVHLSDLATVEKSIPQDHSLIPRYVRVNTLLTSVQEVVELFQQDGWHMVKTDQDYKQFLAKISNIGHSEFVCDIHIPYLIVFPPRTEFHKHPAYKNGSLILQDKASCLPVHILNPEPGSTILDMCAAPGMKTTQLAAHMSNVGTVFAVERDSSRFEVLNKMINKSGATCIKTFNRDILKCSSEDFPNVQYILVDPSCSGSGITNRLEFEEARNASRLEKLAGFQIKILRSALTRYPDAKKVVYSTCSIYPDENENVVRQVLETNDQFRLVSAKKFLHNQWMNFGSNRFTNIGKRCIYAKPEDDLTNGFFVAVFKRTTETKKNILFNANVANRFKNTSKTFEVETTASYKNQSRKHKYDSEEVCDS